MVEMEQMDTGGVLGRLIGLATSEEKNRSIRVSWKGGVMGVQRGGERLPSETVRMVGRGSVQDDGFLLSVDHLLDLFESFRWCVRRNER